MSRKNQRDFIRKTLREELESVLTDISYRLGVLYDAQRESGRIGSRDLNLASHILDGFTVTDNTPAGGITWADVNIVYKGTNYVITGASTTMKYVWWDYSANPNTVLQTSNTKPTLTEDDVLVFVNNNGVHQTAMSSGKMISGAAILDGTVGGPEIGALAIAGSHIASNAITSTKINDGAVVAGKLATDSVASGNIAAGAVIVGKLGTGANAPVGSTNIVAGAVGNTAIADNAVTTAKITDGNITTAKLGSKVVDSTKLADAAVGSTQLADNAVTTSKITDGNITNAKIGAGQIAANKLNVAQHMLF